MRSIFDPADLNSSDYLPTLLLQEILDDRIVGLRLGGLPLKSRSKVLKEAVCEALGYDVPIRFRKTQPRFPCQNMDVFGQKSRNLQVWNEKLSPTRRYAIFQINNHGVVTAVRVASGAELAKFDKTGTLTGKYQARASFDKTTELYSVSDSAALKPYLSDESVLYRPSADPIAENVLPIGAIFERLVHLIGTRIPYRGKDQERLQGESLHRMVSASLGYGIHADRGSFPDIREQLLEIKLQTSPTIDLGLILPSSIEPLDIAQLGQDKVKHCDVRYAVFGGSVIGNEVQIEHLVMLIGAEFDKRFRLFQGLQINKKLQIPLPSTFFASVSGLE